MLISTPKMRIPTSIKMHQGNRYLMHTYPCGISPLLPPRISISKAVCQNLPCGTTKADHCIGPRDWTTQMSKVNNADLGHGQNLRTHVYFQNPYSGSAKEEKVLMKSKWAPEARNKWTDCYLAWGKYYFFLIWFTAMLPSDLAICVFHF